MLQVPEGGGLLREVFGGPGARAHEAQLHRAARLRRLRLGLPRLLQPQPPQTALGPESDPQRHHHAVRSREAARDEEGSEARVSRCKMGGQHEFASQRQFLTLQGQDTPKFQTG